MEHRPPNKSDAFQRGERLLELRNCFQSSVELIFEMPVVGDKISYIIETRLWKAVSDRSLEILGRFQIMISLSSLDVN